MEKKSVSDTLEYVKECICDKYCKFPDEYNGKFKDPNVAQEQLLREKCEHCILEML